MAELSALIERHMLGPFEWGVSDCCLAACNIWRDAGWPDPAAPYRGRYSDEAGARTVMAGTVEDVAERETQRLGWPEIDSADAQDWDAGVIGNSLAIHCDGWWHLKARSEDGTEHGYVMKRRVRRAWRPNLNRSPVRRQMSATCHPIKIDA